MIRPIRRPKSNRDLAKRQQDRAAEERPLVPPAVKKVRVHEIENPVHHGVADQCGTKAFELEGAFFAYLLGLIVLG